MTRHKARHACADYLYELREYRLGDTVYCSCNRQWTLRPLTWVRVVASWLRPIVATHDSDERVWVRDRKAERAARRERILREREARRG